MQIFEEALISKLNANAALTALVGSSIYIAALPQTHDLGAQGPALTYVVPAKPRGHVLVGADGTATARIQLDAWSYSEAACKAILEAIRTNIDGDSLSNVWGDGSVIIMSCIQQDDIDLDEAPEAGTDQVLYHSVSEYSVKYRVGPIPPA